MTMKNMTAETPALMYATACRAIKERICDNLVDMTQRTVFIPELNLHTKMS